MLALLSAVALLAGSTIQALVALRGLLRKHAAEDSTVRAGHDELLRQGIEDVRALPDDKRDLATAARAFEPANRYVADDEPGWRARRRQTWAHFIGWALVWVAALLAVIAACRGL
ncbi:hypothetical protein [Segeticoccus rhizosphaerae]|uniref:hypothetical protein n=1 Tax=Segeticoccus rhizosphaerae TaxID=1104777 RepID=UPI0010BFD41B|nr:hypothetical protein [Ornithinicoccus soli]